MEMKTSGFLVSPASYRSFKISKPKVSSNHKGKKKIKQTMDTLPLLLTDEHPFVNVVFSDYSISCRFRDTAEGTNFQQTNHRLHSQPKVISWYEDSPSNMPQKLPFR